MEGRIDFARETFRHAELLFRSGKYAEAAQIYEGLLLSGADGYGQRVNYAQCLKRLGLWQEAIKQFELAFSLRRCDAGQQQQNTGQLSTYYVQHLVEQLTFLSASGRIKAPSQDELDSLQRVQRFLNDCYGRNGSGMIPLELTRPVAHILQGCANYAPQAAAAVEINPAARMERIDLGLEQSPVYVFDDLLQPSTLAALRSFLVDSTIWYDARPERGYLGAHLHDGLACPLVENTAEAARALAFPLIGVTQISQVWTFKYAPKAAGIDLHADQASWNVNIWLTDEACNKDPSGGGLTIYGCEAPAEWHFEMYNASPHRVHQHLAAAGAPSRRIAYRANRAILFNSRLFHKTDPVDFSTGYPDRRINMTVMLDTIT